MHKYKTWLTLVIELNENELHSRYSYELPSFTHQTSSKLVFYSCLHWTLELCSHFFVCNYDFCRFSWSGMRLDSDAGHGCRICTQETCSWSILQAEGAGGPHREPRWREPGKICKLKTALLIGRSSTPSCVTAVLDATLWVLLDF